MIAPTRSKLLTKHMLLTLLVETALLAASIYGFMSVAESALGTKTARILTLLVTGVAPLGAFIYIAMREAIGAADLLAAGGYQHRIDELQKRLNDQDDFFHTINNNTPSTLTIYNNDGNYWFVNTSAARELGVSENEILGRQPVEILGADRGRKISKSLALARLSTETLEVFDQYTELDGSTHYTQTRYHPLASFGEFPGGIMAHGENITSIVQERERRETQLRQVISTLVAVVDRRDPYASGHSSRVGLLARALASELQMTQDEIETAEIAGSLMNFGKVLVSRAILTKTEALTPDELQRIRDGILTSADILQRIDFSTPVVPTLRQVLEKYDGTGVPNRLAGDAILMSARILAVANAFVAMVSPRAYRAGTDLLEAARALAQNGGTSFDPKVITALQSYLSKNASKLDWLTVSKSAAAS